MNLANGGSARWITFLVSGTNTISKLSKYLYSETWNWQLSRGKASFFFKLNKMDTFFALLAKSWWKMLLLETCCIYLRKVKSIAWNASITGDECFQKQFLSFIYDVLRFPLPVFKKKNPSSWNIQRFHDCYHVLCCDLRRSRRTLFWNTHATQKEDEIIPLHLLFWKGNVGLCLRVFSKILEYEAKHFSYVRDFQNIMC